MQRVIYSYCNCNLSQSIAVSEVLEILQQTTDTCEILGRTESKTVGLIDPKYPNTGIYIQYGGGDPCTNSDNPSNNGSPRQTRFNIYCAKKQDEVIKPNSSITYSL